MKCASGGRLCAVNVKLTMRYPIGAGLLARFIRQKARERLAGVA
jgi:hypothetical protein